MLKNSWNLLREPADAGIDMGEGRGFRVFLRGKRPILVTLRGLIHPSYGEVDQAQAISPANRSKLSHRCANVRFGAAQEACTCNRRQEMHESGDQVRVGIIQRGKEGSRRKHVPSSSSNRALRTPRGAPRSIRDADWRR